MCENCGNHGKNEIFQYPSRENIKSELLAKSDFTQEEVDSMSFDNMYEYYGRIVRYKEENVEESFRKKA